jgi:hypothetical protein
MATTDIRREEYADPALAVTGTTLRRPLFPQVRWGAVLAGVAVGISIQLVLALLGLATGLSTLDVAQGERPGGTAPVVWAGISMLISAFVGGYVAARMSGFKRKSDGVMHGAVSWAVTTLLFALLATSVTGSLLSGIFSSVAPTAARTAAQGGSPAVQMLQRELGTNIDAATLQRVQRDIQTGNRDDAVSALTGAGVASDKAATVVDQALIATGSPEQASPQSRAAADRAVGTAGKAAWGVFLAVALSLALGIGGGVLGAAGSRRVAWATPGVAPA